MTPDDELSREARRLHREWPSPELWPSIAAEMAAIERAERRTRRLRLSSLAAAAVLVLAAAGSLWLMRPGERAPRPAVPAAVDQRLLSEAAMAEVERAEAAYVTAIDTLAAKAAAAATARPSPLLANLRERLLVIDAAIADCRAEIDRNRFNAHLRRQLLAIYQEKRRTLEQILELEQHAS